MYIGKSFILQCEKCGDLKHFQEDISEVYEVPPDKAMMVCEMIKSKTEPSSIVDYVLARNNYELRIKGFI